MKSILLASLACLLSLAPAGAQGGPAEPANVEAQIAELDRVLFHEGFNECRLDALVSIIADDLEFYHDLAGPSFGREPFLDAVRRNICSATGDQKPIRRLDGASVVVHPLYQDGTLYGAVQTGEHAFYLGRGENAPLTSTARFTHLWRLDAGTWSLSRVLSYDHRVPEPDLRAGL